MEETGLEVDVGSLLYVAEVVGGVTMQELNLLFLAGWDGAGDDVLLLGADDPRRAEVMPALLDVVFEDLAAGWARTPRFLGNVHAPATGAG